MDQLQRFRWPITAGLLLLAAGGGYLLWRGGPSPPSAPPAILIVTNPTAPPTARPTPSPTDEPIVVYVSGAVVRPGVYALPPGARVADAVEAAGGATAAADLIQLNLARRVHDEEQIHVPREGDPTRVLPTTVTAPAGDPSAGGGSSLVNINTAGLAELDALPGIGPGYAQRIIDYREANGPFRSVEEIQNVPGIGPSTFARIRDLICVSP